MSTPNEIRARLRACKAGHVGWREFEDACIEALTYLFVPPLTKPHLQPRSYSGIDRRDAIFPNRNHEGSGNWGYLHKDLDAKPILFEFKNYDSTEIGKEEVDQTRNYLTEPMGRLAVLCANKEPEKAAHIRRNSIYSAEKKSFSSSPRPTWSR